LWNLFNKKGCRLKRKTAIDIPIKDKVPITVKKLSTFLQHILYLEARTKKQIGCR